MNRTDSTASVPDREFPRLELDPERHREIRDLLVQQARPPDQTSKASLVQRFSSLNWAVPAAAALAVVLAVAGSGLVVRAIGGDHDRSRTVSPAGGKNQKGSLHCRPGMGPIGDPHAAPVSPRPVPFAQGDGLRYLIPTPAGGQLRTSLLSRLHCTDGRTPVATYVKRDGDTITQALTVFTGKQNYRPAVSPDSVVRVTVRSRPGLVLDGTELLWTEAGGRNWEIWSADTVPHTGTQTEDRPDLVAIAGELRLARGTATWPQAAAKGYDLIAVPTPTAFKDQSRQLVWSVDYTSPQTAGGRSSEILVSRDAWPWQGTIAVWGGAGRLVEVNGLHGFLTTGPLAIPTLYLSAADGIQLIISGADPLQFAQHLAPVRADDPRLRFDPQAAAHWAPTGGGTLGE